MAKFPASLRGAGLLEATLEVSGLEAMSPDEAIKEVEKLVAPGYDVLGVDFRIDHYHRGPLVGEMTVTAKIMPTRPPPVTYTVETPMRSNIEVHFDLTLLPTNIEDATTLGAFVDECRGYISERLRHYKMSQAEPFTVNVEMPGYAPEVTSS